MNLNGSIASSNVAVSFASSNKSNTTKQKPRQLRKCKLKSSKSRQHVQSSPASLLIYRNLNASLASGTLSSLTKIQVSILNTGLINIDKEIDKVSKMINYQPFDLSESKFDKYIHLLRKYLVLLKIEFCVSLLFSTFC